MPGPARAQGESPRVHRWPTGVWERENVGMCWAEARLVRLVERYVEGTRERRQNGLLDVRWIAGTVGVSTQIWMRCK